MDLCLFNGAVRKSVSFLNADFQFSFLLPDNGVLSCESCKLYYAFSCIFVIWSLDIPLHNRLDPDGGFYCQTEEQKSFPEQYGVK